MSVEEHKITRTDIIDMAVYGEERQQRRSEISQIKKNRRVHVGPDATFYFESYDTMCYQVHEMLYIERGGEGQIGGELEAYNPLIPQGSELIATLMIEIENEDRRRETLAKLGGVEECLSIKIDGMIVKAVAERDLDRTTAAGKASSVHFVHFPFGGESIAAFRQDGAEVIVAIDHPAYSHMAKMTEETRAALVQDFD
ncbi:MAG: DUF3501 family protein [Rhodospirillaceae bacterium]|jgi:hypothetical protein|nr:DUF3501 family protein [Rhodospirillaceae bacterium]MBT5374011.1 DUF3501 family protein [Rhodospirillaceae bacterium]MBT5751159.1 DUF3501 family protein [Rhodospirillaceae bacterium]